RPRRLRLRPDRRGPRRLRRRAPLPRGREARGRAPARARAVPPRRGSRGAASLGREGGSHPLLRRGSLGRELLLRDAHVLLVPALELPLPVAAPGLPRPLLHPAAVLALLGQLPVRPPEAPMPGARPVARGSLRGELPVLAPEAHRALDVGPEVEAL